MTKAGLDPSRIQERAEMLAKVQGAKRKRNADEDVEMDEDDEDDDASHGGSDEGMDVDDDDESSPAKRVKTNSGGVINKRAPRSNRHMAGMRDEGVIASFTFFLLRKLILLLFLFSNSPVQPSFAILVNVLAICLRKQEKEIVLSEPKW